MLLDLKLPDLDGLTVLQRVKALAPETSVVIVTMHDDPEFIRRAVELGAAGYVLKGITRRELVATIGAVCEGESVLAPDALRRLLGGVARVSTAGADGPSWTGLTQVERSVLAMLAPWNVEAVGAAERRSPLMVPALKLSGFAFTSTSDAI